MGKSYAIIYVKAIDVSRLLKEDGNQSAAGLAEILASSPSTVQRALKRLMDDGKIGHVGSNRFGHYIIKEDL